MTDIFEENVDVFDEVELEERPKTPWPLETSIAFSTRLATAAHNNDAAAVAAIHAELTGSGRSPTADSLGMSIKELKVQAAASASSDLVPELGAEQTARILNDRINSIGKANINDLVQEEIVTQAVATSPEDFSEEQFHAIMDEETRIYAETMQRRADHEFFSGGVVKGIVDFAGSLVPFAEANSWRRLITKLEDAYGADFGVEQGTYVMQGEYSTLVRDWYDGLSTDERLDVLKTVEEALPDMSGYFGNNDFIRNSILSTIIEDAEGGKLDLDNEENTTQIIDNMGSALEVLGVGGVVRDGKTIYRAAKGLKDRASAASILERTNKEAAARAQATAAMGTAEDAAKMGVSKEEIIADNMMPKWADYEATPHISSELMEQQNDAIKRAMNSGTDLELHLTEAERTAQVTNMQATLSGARKGVLWDNASSIDKVEGGYKINARYGKNSTTGFKTVDEAEQMAAEMKTKFPAANISVIRKEYDGSVVPARMTRYEKAVADLTEATRIAVSTSGRKVKELIEKSKKTALSDREKNFIRRHADDTYNLDVLEKGEDVSKLRGYGATAMAKLKRSMGSKADNFTTKTEADTTIAALEDSIAKNQAKVTDLTDKMDTGYVPTPKERTFLENHLKELKELKATREAQPTSELPTEYFVDVAHTDKYKLETPGKDVFIDMNDIIYTGDAAKYFADISSGLAKSLSDSFYRAHDKMKKLERDMLSILRPFLEASNDNKKRVISLVDEGSTYRNADGTIGKNFTAEEVLQRLPDNLSGEDLSEVMSGYMSMRQMADVSHAVLNRSLRDNLKAEGYVHVKHGDFDYLGVRVEAPIRDDLPSKVYDLETKSLIDLPTDLSNVTVYKSKELLGKGNSYATHFITNAKSQVNDLPAEVLSYRAGYVPRMYKENYFITMTPKTAYIDGRKVPLTETPLKTIAIAKSEKEAKAAIEALKEKHPDMEIDFKHDRKLTSSGILEQEMSLQFNTGGMFYSKRADHLAQEGGKLAETENAVAAISRMAASVARRTELTPVINLHKQRWLSKFGSITNGRFPKTKHDILVNPNRVSDETIEKARAYWDYIDMQVSSGSISADWKAKAVRFSEIVEGKFGNSKIGASVGNASGKVIRAAGDFDPISKIRGLTFTSMIVLNPFRQLFINSQQQLFLSSLDPKYVGSGSALRDSWKMSRIAIKAHPEDREKALAELSGMDRDMAEGFLESGLIEAVDSHLIGRDAMFQIDKEITSSKIGAAYQKVTNLGKGALGFARTYGFDFGEILNIGSTYGIAYRRWIKNNPGKSASTKEARYAIAADARQMSFGMTQAGSLGYQRGWLSLPFQFMPVQHKAFMAMIGQNKAFTKAESRRIALSQVLLFGASGVGVGAAIDSILDKSGVEVNPYVRDALIGGAYDLTINSAVNMLTDSDSHLYVSKNIAAGSGWADTFMSKLSDFHNSSALDFLLGPSSTTMSRFGNAFTMVGSIVGARVFSDEDFDTGDDARAALNAWASIASVYANIKKGYAMYEHGGVVDKALNAAGIPLHTKDAVMKGLLGIGTYEEEAYYDHVTKVSEKKKWMTEVASLYYTRAAERYALWEKQGQYPSVDLILQVNGRERQTLEALYGPRDAKQILGMVEEMIKYRSERGEDEVLNQVAKAAQQGTYGDSFEEIISNLKQAGHLDEEQARILINVEGFQTQSE